MEEAKTAMEASLKRERDRLTVISLTVVADRGVHPLPVHVGVGRMFREFG